MAVAIVTDTSSGISIEEGKNNGFFVVSIPVIVDGETYFEYENITHSELYVDIRKKREISTSQPAIGIITEMWDNLLKNGYDEIVYIPITSGLSMSCAMATQFAQDFEGKVQVVDNHRISVPLKESVYDALYMANNGMDAKTIKQRLEANGLNASIYITVNNLDRLKKSGRVSSTSALVASLLNIKPILSIQGEKLDLFTKVQGMKKAIKTMVEAIKKDINTRFSKFNSNQMIVATAGTLEKQEDIDDLVKTVQQEFPEYQVKYDALTCAIACHIGINAIGVGVAVKER